MVSIRMNRNFQRNKNLKKLKVAEDYIKLHFGTIGITKGIGYVVGVSLRL